MALTNFAALTALQKTVWSRDLWQNARDQMFIKRFTGTGDNSLIQRITDLTKTERGEKVLMHLVADLTTDGVVGDNPREGNEEAMQSYSLDLQIDLISQQVRNKGKMADQKTIVNFREQARDKLAYWLANRLDQLAFLTLSGVSYAYHTDGSARANSALAQLSFAADVSAPTTHRHRRWDVSTTNTLQVGSTADVAATDTPSYEMIVQLVAYAKTHYVKPLMSGGKEYYVLLVHPGALSKLKMDPAYRDAIVNAAPKGDQNPFFTGATVTVDGAVLHEHRLVFNTLGLASGSKWGGGTVDGTRTLLCGAQALAMADLGPPEWAEESFDYGAQQGISVDKMFGFRKPKFLSPCDGAVEDFGVVACDHAL